MLMKNKVFEDSFFARYTVVGMVIDVNYFNHCVLKVFEIKNFLVISIRDRIVRKSKHIFGVGNPTIKNLNK